MLGISLVVTASFIGSFGAVFLKSGSQHLSMDWRSVIFNWRLMLGVGSFVLSSLFFVVGLRHGDLSVLYPMVSLGYIWTLLWSKLFFGEPFTRFKILGLLLILLGTTMLGMGNRH
jgi:drug/metabolite transporter (DMT)-like permease